jgi:1-acyl-sn-glycerol-3-phosphate acyltransferase
MILSIFKLLYALFASLAVGIVELVAFPFDPKGRVFYWLSQFHSASVLKVCGATLKVEGLEYLKPGQKYIFVSNHASLFDIPAVVLGLRQEIRIMYKKELSWIPIWGWALRWSNVYIGVERGKGVDAIRSLEKAAEKMRGGASVLLFAEGTRTKNGKLQPFKRGAFYLALRSGYSVVPLTINGSYGILQKNSLRIKPGAITIVLDKPIEPPAEYSKEAELALRDRVHAIIQQHYIEQ